MPVAYKRWFIERVSKELRGPDGSDEGQPSRALHHDTPESREIQGRQRSHVPSRLRRFT